MTSDAASRKSRIDAALKRATDAGDVPGVVAMATDRNSTIYEGAFGKRVLGQPAAMTADTVAWIASMTKAITAAGAMQLVEQGKLDLDAPAGKVVPEIAAAQVLEGFDANGQPRTRPPKRAITLRHLLTHTAGFGYEIWSADIGKYQEAKGLPGIITCQNAALTTPLLFDPGERWFYGINIDWAGKMVEAVSGSGSAPICSRTCSAPLGMTSTAFKITPGDARAAGKIHQRGDDDKLVPQMELELPQEPEFEMGGGGLYSTAQSSTAACAAPRPRSMERARRAGRSREVYFAHRADVVWTGGALQEKSVKLECSGLAPMYPAFGWSSCAPGHHGYKRAFDLISG